MATKGYYRKTVRFAAGAAAVGASVTIDELDGSAAVVENASGTTLSQPLTTDANGVFEFYALYGSYDITVDNGGDVAILPQQLIGPDQATTYTKTEVDGLLDDTTAEIGQAVNDHVALPDPHTQYEPRLSANVVWDSVSDDYSREHVTSGVTPIHEAMRRCVVRDDKTVAYYNAQRSGAWLRG